MRLKTFAALALTLFVAIAASLATNALAQSTGGSFGGGSFGGGGGGSSSSGSDRSYGGGSSSGSSGGYSSGSSSGSSGGYGGSDDTPSYGGSRPYSGKYSGSGSSEPFPAELAFLVFFVSAFAIGIAMLYGQSRDKAHSNAILAFENDTPDAVELCDVTSISLALDWRAREQIQKKLEALARTSDTSSPGALTHMLRETVTALRGAHISWLYASAVSTTPKRMSKAEPIFRSIANEMRSRFRHEIVRNAAGQILESDTPQLRAREAEGKGVVVVTLLVAARRGIRDIEEATNATELHVVLKILGALEPADLVALEVIWSPAAENDRMSTAELEVIYPELRKIREDTIAGRVFCGYCSGPFAAELDRCPHCGAAASDAAKRS